MQRTFAKDGLGISGEICAAAMICEVEGGKEEIDYSTQINAGIRWR
jgi:hypothetical protein